MNSQLILPTIMLFAFIFVVSLLLRSLRPRRSSVGLKRAKLKNEIDKILKKNKDGF
tara:strand:- start:2286 stop:2453 length:168 start_codon:yes stop_codon:yes gene_type:complete